MRRSVRAMLKPGIVLDLLKSFTVFATDRKHRRIKIISRYQQCEGANLIVRRVIDGYPKGLLWHFQGSGKSLLMVFASQRLRMHKALANPTVIVVVGRIDLDTRITATFNAADVPYMVGADSRKELQDLLAADTRKTIITTIHKFGEAEGRLNERSNIIVMVDEAHRTQEVTSGARCGRLCRTLSSSALPARPSTSATATPLGLRAEEDEEEAT